MADSATGFRRLSLSSAGEPYITRTEGVGAAKSGRAARRTSLAYFGQLSDFQLADEESPARVEALDAVLPQFSAAFRPWESLEPMIDDAMIRQVNAFADAGPVAAAERPPPEDGLHDRHRRLRRQPAAERDRVGADPARGRHPGPEQRHRPRRQPEPALRGQRGPRERPRRRSTPASRIPPTTPTPPSTPPTSPPRRGALRRLPPVHGADEPRPAELHRGRPRRPQLRHLRQPRRPRPGQRRRQDRLRDGRHRLHQAAQRRSSPTAAPSSTSRSRTSSTCTTWLPPATRSSPRPTRSAASSPRASTSRSSSRGSQADGHGFDYVDPGPGGGLGRRRRLLRLQPGPGAEADLARHGLRGRRDRHLRGRQHRRPAVPLAGG